MSHRMGSMGFMGLWNLLCQSPCARAHWREGSRQTHGTHETHCRSIVTRVAGPVERGFSHPVNTSPRAGGES